MGGTVLRASGLAAAGADGVVVVVGISRGRRAVQVVLFRAPGIRPHAISSQLSVDPSPSRLHMLRFRGFYGFGLSHSVVHFGGCQTNSSSDSYSDCEMKTKRSELPKLEHSASAITKHWAHARTESNPKRGEASRERVSTVSRSVWSERVSPLRSDGRLKSAAPSIADRDG